MRETCRDCGNEYERKAGRWRSICDDCMGARAALVRATEAGKVPDFAKVQRQIANGRGGSARRAIDAALKRAGALGKEEA